MPGFARLSLWEMASAALGDRWVPWEVGDGSLRWTAGATIGRPVGGRAGVALATAAHEVPSRSMHDPTDVLAGALWGTGWLTVTVGGIHPGVRHHELRPETAGENPENPARWWPLPRHG